MKSETYNSEEEGIERDTAFNRIYDGGVIKDATLTIRSQVSIHGDRWYYNDRPYTRSSWSWRPCRFVRSLGRMAREYPDGSNTHPMIDLMTESGQVIQVDNCPVCGGDLVLDERDELYCTECYVIW